MKSVNLLILFLGTIAYKLRSKPTELHRRIYTISTKLGFELAKARPRTLFQPGEILKIIPADKLNPLLVSNASRPMVGLCYRGF